MKNLFRTTILILTGLLTVVSCDDYVNIDPEFTLDADNYFKSPSDYDKALTGAYDLLQTSYLRPAVDYDKLEEVLILPPLKTDDMISEAR